MNFKNGTWIKISNTDKAYGIPFNNKTSTLLAFFLAYAMMVGRKLIIKLNKKPPKVTIIFISFLSACQLASFYFYLLLIAISVLKKKKAP